MKLRIGRGSAVLEAPEESYALRTTLSPEVPVREPAPAGALQRGAFPPEPAAFQADEEPYIPRRGTDGVPFRLRASVPNSLAGRIVAAAALLLFAGAVVITVTGVRRYLTHDDRFAIATSSEIEIQGNEHLTRAQILNVFGADLERNIFKVPLAERRSDLERLPWIAHATVMRLLPNHLRINITERVPVAFVRQGTELGLVDANGVLLDMPAESAGDPHYSFPVLTGLAPDDPLPVRAARMAVYAKFLHELDGSGQKLSQNLSEVDVSNPEDVKALVASGGTDVLVHFGDEKFLERYQQFEQHLPEWKTQYPKLAAADMRYERQVVLEMAKGTAVPLAGDAASTAPAAAPAHATAAPAAAKNPAVRPAAAVHAPARRAAPAHATPAAHPPAATSMAQRIAAARAAHVPDTVAAGSAAAGRGAQ